MRWDNQHKDKLRQRVKRLRAVKTWQLVVLVLLGSIVAASFLRLNNLAMVERRQAVIEADEKGDATEIKATLGELQRYVTTHMNTSLDGGFYLAKSYERAREAAMAQAQDTSSPNSDAYRQAGIACQTERFRVAGGYVQCVINKVNALGGTANPVSELKLPPPELYKVNFASPTWSPDLAGFAVAFCVVILLVIIARFMGVVFLDLLLKRRFSNV